MGVETEEIVTVVPVAQVSTYQPNTCMDFAVVAVADKKTLLLSPCIDEVQLKETDIYGNCNLKAVIGDNAQSVGPVTLLTHFSSPQPCAHVTELEVGPTNSFSSSGVGRFDNTILDLGLVCSKA